jgi:Flp pilus assembly secretin CpaC
VLSTPQLMTLDNTEATFESTDKIPVPQVNNAGLGIQTTSINYQSVPLSIKIKPQLNKVSNFIKMDIKAKVSNISNRALPKGVQDLAYATLDRSAETSVMVADSDTIVLGGLSRDNDSETINKVPFLGDIPILGWLFKSKSTTLEKSNLLLFITPHIMRQPADVRAMLDKKLKERDVFVETSMGGIDGQREERDTIIRNLPDVKDITNYNNAHANNIDDEQRGIHRTAKAESSASPDTLTLPAADPVGNPNQPASGNNSAPPPVEAPPIEAPPAPPAAAPGGNP